MKNAIFPSILVFTMILFFASNQSLKAHQSDEALAFSKRETPHSTSVPQSKTNDEKPRYQFDINDGQHQASFDGLREYVAAHLTCPALARENVIEGTMIILAVFSPEGKVMEATVVESSVSAATKRPLPSC